MNKISTAAKKIKKEIKKEVDVPSLISYLEKLGYSTVFFNTESGDEILKAYGIDLNNLIAKAFTYSGSTRIVFIDNTMHTNSKVYSLLHEIGHILLGHIGNGNIALKDNRILENEAEAFVYAVLNKKKPSRLTIALAIVNIGLIFILIAFCMPKNVPTYSSSSEYVYVTPSGTKYHTQNCIHAKSKERVMLEVTQAKKTYSPCSVCNP